MSVVLESEGGEGPRGMKGRSTSKRSQALMRKILSEDEVRLLRRQLGKVLGPMIGEIPSHYGVEIEDTIRFGAAATRLREARESRGMDLKAAAKAIGVPQYRLRYIEECSVKNLRASDLRAYIEFLGLSRWFARWSGANPKLAARLTAQSEVGLLKSDRQTL